MDSGEADEEERGSESARVDEDCERWGERTGDPGSRALGRTARGGDESPRWRMGGGGFELAKSVMLLCEAPSRAGWLSRSSDEVFPRIPNEPRGICLRERSELVWTLVSFGSLGWFLGALEPSDWLKLWSMRMCSAWSSRMVYIPCRWAIF